MSRYILRIVLLLIFLVGSVAVVYGQRKDVARETAMCLQRLIQEKQAQGTDVSKAIELDRQSREAMRQGRPKECLRLLKQAIALLEKDQKEPQVKSQSKPRISFFEVHLEPRNANNEMFDALRELVNLAGQYKVKLTLLFTPQWAEMILKDDKKLNLIKRWRQKGHEIGGHHHGPSVCPWDGYANLDINSREFKERQNRISCPRFVRAKEEYLGNMEDYMKLLNKLGPIKTITMSDADINWPEGAVYSAGGRRLQMAISQPATLTYNNQEVYKLSSSPLKSTKTVLGELVTIDDLKNEYLSDKKGVFGINAHAVDYKNNPNLYKQWFEFLKQQDPKMSYAKTISQIIIEGFSEPTKKQQGRIPSVDQQKITNYNYQDSPFGVSDGYDRPYITDNIPGEKVLQMSFELKEPYKSLQDIDVKWVRPPLLNLIWKMAQPTQEHLKKGLYEWDFIDKYYGNVPEGINVLACIGVRQGIKRGTWEFVSKKIEGKYIKFVKELVERYDGDGYKDMPGLKNPIKYWQVENEPVLQQVARPVRQANLDWQSFSHLLEITYRAIKDADPETKVLMAGLAGGNAINTDDPLFHEQLNKFYIPLLHNLKGRYIDIFDIHCYGPPSGGIDGWKASKDTYKVIRKALDKNGYQNTEIWFTETGTDSKQGGEKLQAIDLFKRFIYPLSYGVKKIFWWSMIEGEYPLEDNQPSDHFGLIYDGIGKEDPGYGTKKLAYYTYKKMVEVLEGSEWNNIQTIKEEENDAYGIYLYKFIKNGKSIYIGWYDCFDEQECMRMKIDTRVEIAINANYVKITEAVPKYKSGKDITDYNTAFNTEIKSISDQEITITLNDIPIFVEEI